MKRIKKIFYMPLAIVMLLMLSSCNLIFDEYPEDGDDMKAVIMLSLSRDGAETRAAFPQSGDDAITKARIIVFNGSVVEHNQVYSASNPPFDNPIRIEVATGTKTIYVVTNESSVVLTDALTAVTSEADIQAIMADQISEALSVPFVMIGKETVTLNEPGLSNLSVTVKRLAAKINLQFKKDTTADVKINKVSLLKNTTKSTLWEGAALIGTQGYWNHTNNGSMTLSNSFQDYLTLYVYENLGNSSSNKTNATQLEVEASYDGLPTVYRVYINENVTSVVNPGDPMSSVTNPNDHLYNIKRNYQYNLTGTIKALGDFQGLTIFTEVQPWDGVNKTYFVGYGYTVEVDGKNVIVSNHDEDCPPHVIKLVGLNGFTLNGETEQIFEETDAGVTKEFTLNNEPVDGSGMYLEVWYNGVLVNIFTK